MAATKSNESKPNWADRLDALVDSGAFPAAIHRILLWGPPSTGKSSWAPRKLGQCERLTVYQQMPVEEVVGSYVLEAEYGASRTRWVDGPAVRAMRSGIPLVIDEIDQIGGDLRCVMHTLLDDQGLAGLTLPTGERVTPVAGFCVICTCNPSPERLPEALLSRLVCVYCGEPAAGALESLSHGYREVAQRSYERLEVARYIPAVTLRTIASVQSLAGLIGLTEAAKLVLGESEAASDLEVAIAVQESV